MANNVKGIRMEEETRAAFERLAVESGLPQEQVMALLIQTYNEEAARQSNPGRVAEIDRVRELAEKLVNAYITSLDIAVEAEEKAAERVAKELQSNEERVATLTDEIKALRAALDKTREDAEQLVSDAEKSAAESANALAANTEQLNIAQQRTAELQDTVDTQKQLITTLQRDIDAAHADTATQTERADELESRYNVFAAETKKAQTEEKAKLVAAEEKAGQLAAELATEKELIIKLQSAAEKYKEISDSTAKQAAQVQSLLERQLADSKAQLKEYKDAAAKRETELLTRIAALEADCKTIDADNKQLQQQLAQQRQRQSNDGR